MCVYLLETGGECLDLVLVFFLTLVGLIVVNLTMRTFSNLNYFVPINENNLKMNIRSTAYVSVYCCSIMTM